MLLPIEPVAPERALVRVSKMVATTVQTLEQMGAVFPFLCLELWWVDFVIGLAAPTKFPMMFCLVWAIAFDTSGILNLAQKHSVAPFLVVFVLQYAGVHVGTPDRHDIIPNIETSVD